MRKVKALLVILSLAIAVQGFAMKGTPDFAMGVEVTCVDLKTVGAMLTMHMPGVPLYLGLGADFYKQLSGETELTATVDYWLMHTNKGFLNFYLGLGLYGAMTPDQSWYAAGLRLPVGIQTWPLNNEDLEMFLEAAPAWVPIQTDERVWDEFQVQLALGFRFWFDK